MLAHNLELLALLALGAGAQSFPELGDGRARLAAADERKQRLLERREARGAPLDER